MTPKTDGCELITLCSYLQQGRNIYMYGLTWWECNLNFPLISNNQVIDLYLWSVLSDKRWPGRRRPNFPQTSDTPEGQAQLRAFQRQRTQGPGRYESASSHILHLPKKDLYVPSYLISYIFRTLMVLPNQSTSITRNTPLDILDR